MTVRWSQQAERIYFTLQFPTSGWGAIGFNESADLSGTYLIMSKVVNGKTEVQEYRTISPGNYHPLSDFGVHNRVSHIHGKEENGKTEIHFSLPVEPSTQYHKSLKAGDSWTILLAYSLEDHFKHHSIMRTSLQIVL